MRTKAWATRRNVLKGLGMTLALPWFESLCQTAKAQPVQAKRYVFVYFPNGTARDFWPAAGEGAGEAWQLSPIQEPLTPYKEHLSVLSNVGQTELFGGTSVNPSHSQLCAPTLSGTINHPSNPVLGGPSVDQVLAQRIGDQTPFPSLQIGLSTHDSYPDGQHPAISRSISWSASDVPLYKEVNPQALFDRITMGLNVGGMATPEQMAEAALRRERNLSVLDYVVADAEALRAKVSFSDQARLDRYLTSVRELEGRVSMPIPPGGGGGVITRPDLVAEYTERTDNKVISVDAEPEGYSRDTHAEVMNDLVQLAFEADLTRVISYMLDDARSDYHYQFLKQRNFTLTGSTEAETNLTTPLQGDLLGYHALQHDGDSNNGFATINHWLVAKFATLLGRLSETLEPDGSGSSLLDNSYLQFQSGMQGSQHNPNQLPIVIAGKGGGLYKTNYHHVFPNEVRLADVHLTALRAGFGLTDAQLGNGQDIVPALLV